MQRNIYDLSHFSHVCGKIGRLQTLAVIPTIAGDSIEVNLDGIIRLAPLRKEVVSESQVDILAFHVPHRHVYGDNWINFVMEGYDESVTFTGISLNVGERDASFLALQEAPASVPTWLVQGYNRIWDRYFRVPSFDPETNLSWYPSGSGIDRKEWRKYGRLCARLAHPINGGIRTSLTAVQTHRDLTDADAEVDTSLGTLDIRSLDLVRGQYRSEIERTWFAERYTDVLDIWGSGVNTDADQRPELCFRETFNMSGTDIDGNDDATLGSYIGKTVSRVKFNMPRKYFAEHGALWVVALVRFPVVHIHEQHYLQTRVNPTSEEILADPNIWANKAPIPFDPSRYVSVSGGTWTANEIVEPYGQWYRRHPNNVHQHFANIPGYPFVKKTLSLPQDGYYHEVGDYDDVFQTSQLGHWQIHSRVGVTALRHVPEATSSIFTGA